VVGGIGAKEGRGDPQTPEVRAGARVLGLFATPLNRVVLDALMARPMRLAELKGTVEAIPQTTLREHLKELTEVGAVVRRQRDERATAVEFELTPVGHELLTVADALERWLAMAPTAPIALDSRRGKEAVKSLARGWDSKILRALATRPLALADLDKLIDAHSYQALDRRLTTMSAAGQLEAIRSSGGRTLYGVTDWVRRGIAPLVMAGRCERRHMQEITAPITHVEVEAAFLLSLPLVQLPRKATGRCVLAVYTGVADSRERPLSGIQIEVEAGEIVRLDESLDPDPPSWCLASANAWMDAVIDGGVAGLRVGGANRRLVLSLIAGLRAVLFA
jgi:DNA-binding HxlR family transcriptional regulator